MSQASKKKSSGIRDRAQRLATRFEGQCLTDKRISIVKGAEAYKFKCINGHVFYKFVTELQSLHPVANRRISKTTTASMHSISSQSSSDSLDREMAKLLREDISCPKSWQGCWCPKCEAFYKSADILAKKCGFKICGDLYSSSLEFKCLKALHSTPLTYSKRLQGNMKCAGCRKDDREAAKERRREEERLQDAYYSEMQEKMFAEARREMEKELAAGATTYGCSSST